MNDDQARDALIEILMAQDWWNCDPSEFADNLLPCVRRLIAAELRAASDALDAEAEIVCTSSPRACDAYGAAADGLRARADAIDPQ